MNTAEIEKMSVDEFLRLNASTQSYWDFARKVASKYADIPQSLNATERNHDAGLVDAQEQAATENGNY